MSCMIPKDTVSGIIVMCNPEARRLAGVPLTNPFLFPHTNSTHHCGGSDVLNTVCKQAKIDSKLISATRQRCRISTQLAKRSVPASDRQYF